MVGEWGGKLTGPDAAWQKAFAAYLRERQIGSFYWCLNPTSRDTGGLLLNDWQRGHAKRGLASLAFPGA